MLKLFKISLVFSLSSLVLFSACTDYVSKIDDQISELKAYQDEDSTEQSSDSNDDAGDKISKSSSSSKKNVSSSSSKVTELDEVFSSSVIRSSSSVVKSSSSAKPQSSSSAVSENLLTDSRDGQVYQTVKIGTQTWMAENLNYETEDSYCYDDKSENCTKYGRLYTWDAAKTACPTNWHLPNNDEWNTLITAVGGRSTAGKMLKSTSGWNGRNGSGNGTDDYSFSALSAGYRGNDGGFNDAGGYANIWSSSEYDSNIAYGMFLDYHSDATHLYDNPKVDGFSVRCLKD